MSGHDQRSGYADIDGRGLLQIEGHQQTTLNFTWESYRSGAQSGHQSIDIVFHLRDGTGNWPSNDDHARLVFSGPDRAIRCGLSDFGSFPAFRFLVSCLRAVRQATSRTRVIKLIVPLSKGNIVRSDVITTRFGFCELIESVMSFAEPLQKYHGQALGESKLLDLRHIFLASAGGFLLHDASDIAEAVDTRGVSLLLEAELQNRLSFPWIVQPAPRRTLAIVDGNAHPSRSVESAKIYLTAKALGIKLVVLDNDDHWLKGPEFQDWREAFLSTKLFQPPDKEMSSQICESLENYGGRVDGIITFRDSYKASVAKVAQELGLPTSNPKALDLAIDKHSLSVFEKRDAYRVSAKGDAALYADKVAPSVWPVMVKPCIGVGSNGCFRVDNASNLVMTLEMVRRSGSPFHRTEFVIEPFCSGPEVCINFVLLGGKILFSDVTDVLPKTAEREVPGTRKTPTFVEQDLVVPSKLPRDELYLLRKRFHKSLLRLGLMDGVFHLEGRVEHSRMEYAMRDGVLDLRDMESASPSSWLIEINARPPGSTVPELTQYTYGIDYRSLALLLALGDRQRVEALSQPFNNALRYTIVMVVIPVDFDHSSCEGIFESEDMCATLLVRRPELAKHVINCGCFLKNGDRIAHPSSGSNKWLAYFHIISLSGRMEALQLAQEVRREVRYRFR